MIKVRSLRFWTALTVAGACLLTANWALPTLRFAWAAQFADAQEAQTRLQPLFAEHPTGPMAQRLALSLSNAAPAARAEALQNLLGATPLVSSDWLDLAVARQGARESLKDVSSALALSSLTGPNEAWVMARRAAFGLPLWEQLPPDVRRGLTGDLIGGWSELGDADRLLLADALTLSSDRSRAEIQAALLLAGAPATPILAALDMAPTKDGGGEAAASDKARPEQDGLARDGDPRAGAASGQAGMR